MCLPACRLFSPSQSVKPSLSQLMARKGPERLQDVHVSPAIKSTLTAIKTVPPPTAPMTDTISAKAPDVAGAVPTVPPVAPTTTAEHQASLHLPAGSAVVRGSCASSHISPHQDEPSSPFAPASASSAGSPWAAFPQGEAGLQLAVHTYMLCAIQHQGITALAPLDVAAQAKRRQTTAVRSAPRPQRWLLATQQC